VKKGKKQTTSDILTYLLFTNASEKKRDTHQGALKKIFDQEKERKFNCNIFPRDKKYLNQSTIRPFYKASQMSTNIEKQSKTIN